MRKQAYVLSVVGYFGVLSFGFAPSIRRSENSPSCFLTGLRDRHFAVTKTRLHDSIEKEVENVEGEIILDVLELYPSAELVMKEMMKHQPLGCTVEESMDTVNDPTIVFVSKVVEGGSADNAGIKVGDVLVGVTGLFGEMTPVLKSGVEKM